MRLLHVTDTHLGIDRWFRGSPPGWRRADDHLDALRSALLPAYAGEVDLVVHSGDLFDRSRPPARAVREATELLAGLGRAVRVVVMPGNHDRQGLSVHLGRIPGVEVHDRPVALLVGDARVGLVPFVRDAAEWAAAAAEVTRDGCDVLFAHQAFDGSRVPGLVFRCGVQADTVGAEHLPEHVRWVLCGHIHPRQVLRVGGSTIVHTGSSERTAFSERFETKGYLLADLAEGTWRFVDLTSRPMHVVRGPGDLAPISEGWLVRVEGNDPELERAAAERGGWLTPAPAPRDTAQMRLFG